LTSPRMLLRPKCTEEEVSRLDSRRDVAFSMIDSLMSRRVFFPDSKDIESDFFPVFPSLQVKTAEFLLFPSNVNDPLLALLSIDSFRFGQGSYSLSKSLSKRTCPARSLRDLILTELRMYGKQAERRLLYPANMSGCSRQGAGFREVPEDRTAGRIFPNGQY